MTQQECKLIRSVSNGYIWTNKKCNIVAFCFVLAFCTKQTSQDFAQEKSQELQNKCISPVMCVMLASKEILSPAWACSICKNQFQLWFPKTFYWNSKKNKEGKADHLAEFWNWLLCQMPAVLLESGVRFHPLQTSMCFQAYTYFCFRAWIISDD